MKYEVTVIIPIYNAEKYIERTIQSVLQQSLSCKIIMVNDASTDNTVTILKKYKELYLERIRVIDRMENRGVAFSRNEAVSQADTPYIAFLDADDWWDIHKLEKQLYKIKESDADVCYSGRELMNANGESTGKIISVPTKITYKELLKGNVIPCSSVLIKRDCALQYPMEHDELHEDYITWLSMLKAGKNFVGIDEPLLKSRLSEGGKSRNKIKSARMTFKVYRYMGMSISKSCFYFIHYVINSIKKYM